MPRPHATSVVAPRTSRPGRWRFVRIALAALGAVAILTATNRAAEAQTAPEQQSGWEFLLSTGTVVPTGVQRDVLQRTSLTAAQITYVAHPALAINATLGWARSRDLASAGDPRLDIYTYDLGAEIRAPQWIAGDAITFSPFAGVGAGGRSYDYRRLRADATHNVAAYASAGGELGLGRVRLRLEARGYVSGFKPLDREGAAHMGNDVVLLAGLRFVRR